MSIEEEWVPEDDGTFLSTIGNVVRRRYGDQVEFGIQTDKRHRNRSGIVHGGVYMALMDRVLGVNVRLAGNGRRMATASLTVNFQRPARVGDFLHATCKLTKNGRKAAFGEATVTVDGVIVATATGVFMTVDAPNET